MEIIPSLVEYNPNIFFIFCRGGANSHIFDVYDRYVKKLGIETHVKIYDEMLTFTKICSIMEESNVMFHLPYLDNGSSAISESMISKNILVLSDNPYYRERVNDGVKAIIVDPDSDKFCEDFKRLLDNISIYDAVFFFFFYLQKNYDYALLNENWNTQASKISEIYDKLI